MTGRPTSAGPAAWLRLGLFALLALAGALMLRAELRAEEEGGTAVVLRLEGAVTPATADYVTRGIARAAERDARLVILAMDTPGGLDPSMRAIIRAILDSPVPVATYVSPSGARAASAGTYILYASHVAAMAPSTNLGSATPVPMGGGMPFQGGDEAEEAAEGETGETGENGEPRPAAPRSAMEAKVVNDAVAYIRGLAELRDRNADWAERAVREAVSLTASAAEREGVIDFVARSMDELLERADGRVVEVAGADRTLATAGLGLVEEEPTLRNRILAIITDPNVALLLMVFGFYGILFELINPGALVPGTIGGISLLTGLYALSVLPVNYAGIGLMLLGLALLVAEAFAPSFGVLGIGGALAITLGATLMFEGGGPGMEVSLAVIAGIAVTTAAVALIVARLAVGSVRARVTTGAEELIGAEARVVAWRGTEGYAHVHGERWRARSAGPLAPGTLARVVRVEGLTLELAPESGTRAGGPRGASPAA